MATESDCSNAPTGRAGLTRAKALTILNKTPEQGLNTNRPETPWTVEILARMEPMSAVFTQVVTFIAALACPKGLERERPHSSSLPA